jgi:hypothetical protein
MRVKAEFNERRNKMIKLSSKTIAIIGIVMYSLSVLLSTEVRNNYIFPQALRLIPDTGILVFIIMTIIRFWKTFRLEALALLVLTIIFFIVGVIQEAGILNVILLFNLTKLIYFLVVLYAIMLLFKMKDNK